MVKNVLSFLFCVEDAPQHLKTIIRKPYKTLVRNLVLRSLEHSFLMPQEHCHRTSPPKDKSPCGPGGAHLIVIYLCTLRNRSFS